MQAEFNCTDEAVNMVSATVPSQTNPFLGYECVLKTCCKKYKKGQTLQEMSELTD